MELKEFILILWLQVDIQESLLQVLTQVHTHTLQKGVTKRATKVTTRVTTKATTKVITMEGYIPWVEHALEDWLEWEWGWSDIKPTKR